MSASIHLGYVVGTGEPVEIPLRHTAVTGQTQESGKTTTLEGLISRSGLQAVAYVTKRGESSFHVANPIPPYFQERADWKFVLSLLEASTETKLKFEQSWIMRASEGAKTLGDVQANIQRFLHGVRDTTPVKLRKGAEVKERWKQKPARGLSGDVYYVLAKYLEDIMPQLGEMPYTTELDLADGLNVMDLRDYEFPLQALVIRSVTDFIREKSEDTINIIPEAWKFAPKQRGSPVRLAAEEYVREAAAMKNFLWIDSQDLAGVADVLMRQVGVWLFGVQRAKHEIERALDHMPEGLPARRPRPADIATLSKGQFYVCFGREMHKVYVQPAWMSAAHAEAIARGEEEVNSASDILEKFDKTARRVAVVKQKVVTDGDRGGSRSISATPRDTGTKAETDAGKNESVSVSSVSGNRTESVRNDSASDRRSQHSDHSTLTEGEDEAMWKEKYEELKRQYDALAKQVAADCPTPINGEMAKWFEKFPESSLEATYQYIRKRLREEDPSDLLTLLKQPELLVKIERPVLTVDGKTLYGRMCQLVSEGFFKQPQTSKVTTAEAVRRGWCHPKTPVMRVTDPLEQLAGMGFLTRETDGYQMVSGVKVKTEEA
jgi:hypothetical protein